jgi:hypothetical protein
MGLLDSKYLNYLPDDPNKKEAMRAGLLQFGAAMLGGRGNFGQHLGQGLSAGAQGYQGALAGQQQAVLDKAQAERWQLENKTTQAALDEPAALQRIMSTPPAAQSAASELAGAAPSQPAGSVMPLNSLPKTGQPAAPAAPQNLFSTYMAYGDRLTQAGRPKQAKEYYDLADKLKPKLKEQRALSKDGKIVMANVYDDGRTEELDGYMPAEKLSFHNTGASTVGLDPYTGKPMQTIRNSQSPDSVARIAADDRQQAAITQRASMAGSDGGAEGLLPPDTVNLMAQQYMAGDTSVMQNLGRGAQGAKNIIAIRNEITRQMTGQGKGGADLAAANAQFMGTKAGQRTAGTRIANVEMAANEAESLIPLAQEASSEVARSGLLPFGKVQIMFDNQTNDPNLRKFAAANNALVNVYARAISPSGTPTVADKEHAREMIGTAIDHKSYMAVTQQMQKEITAARSAPKAVRKAFNDEVTGKDSHAPAAPKAPAAGTVKSGYVFKGGNPADKNNWVKQ